MKLVKKKMAEKKIDLKKIAIGYLLVFGIVMLIYCSVNQPEPIGEWDDYSLPVASILNDHNFSINAKDVMVYKSLYPKWYQYVDSYSLSGYKTIDGKGEIPWYFPTYAIACIPFTIILDLLDLPTIYAFPYTNLAVLMTALFVIYKYLDCDDKRKNLLLVLLTINPIVFYIGWASSEVFIYSMLSIGLVFWYNSWYKRAAFFVSLAGMLNPTIMSIGIVMIIEYIVKLIRDKGKKEQWGAYIKKCLPTLIRYGCCYIIGIVPMIYNFYHTGHINLTASLSGFTKSNESVLSRFWAYILDLNYGLLPYYSVLLIVSVIVLVMSVVKKQWRCLQWIATFLLNVILYSVMIHINCGMAGISRYNAWGVLVLIFAVVLFGGEITKRAQFAQGLRVALYVGAVLTGVVVFSYNPHMAINTSDLEFMPVAQWTLDNVPGLYNPLYSTFNSRMINQYGGYEVKTPLIYTDEDGYVRKILATSADKEVLLKEYRVYSNDKGWFLDKVNNLGDEISYISVPKKYTIGRLLNYEIGESITFKAEGRNAENYVVKGLGSADEWGTWTEGNEFILRLKTNSQNKVLHADIDCGVYNEVQDVTVYVNDNKVYHNPKYKKGGISFNFENPGPDECVEIKIVLPNAVSPEQFGYDDDRVLGLGISEIVISEAIVAGEPADNTISFLADSNNAAQYIVSGMWNPEKDGTWTAGKGTQLRMPISSEAEILHGRIAYSIFNQGQMAIIFVNDELVYRGIVSGEDINFDFKNAEVVKIKIQTPNAISPKAAGISGDDRVIALRLEEITITE